MARRLSSARSVSGTRLPTVRHRYMPSRLFDATKSQHFTVADNAAISMGNNQHFFMSAWAYPTGFAGARTGIFGKWGNATNNNGEYALTVTSGIIWTFKTSTGAATASASYTPDGAIPTSIWAHLLGWYDGTNNYLYLNGTLVATVAATTGAQDIASTLKMGATALSNDFFWTGRIGPCGIWKRDPTVGEIATLAAGALLFSQLPVGLQDGVAYWDNTEQGRLAYDKRGTNQLIPSASPPTWAEGRIPLLVRAVA